MLFPEYSKERIHDLLIKSHIGQDLVSLEELINSNNLHSEIERSWSPWSQVYDQSSDRFLDKEVKSKLRKKLFWELKMFNYKF